ncbi:MAG: response regulator [Anaerolineae bacterium]|nr:response regulator [Anaerolineae bacterium]
MNTSTNLNNRSTSSSNAPLIMLAENNEANISTISNYLQIKGYDVVVVRNGVEVIEQAQQTGPDIILMDIQMPGMDGLSAMRHLRTLNNFSDVPIIAITALAMPGDREKCLDAGANDYLSKPASLRKIVQLIEKYLGNDPVKTE